MIVEMLRRQIAQRVENQVVEAERIRVEKKKIRDAREQLARVASELNALELPMLHGPTPYVLHVEMEDALFCIRPAGRMTPMIQCWPVTSTDGTVLFRLNERLGDLAAVEHYLAEWICARVDLAQYRDVY